MFITNNHIIFAESNYNVKNYADTYFNSLGFQRINSGLILNYKYYYFKTNHSILIHSITKLGGSFFTNLVQSNHIKI